MDKKKKTNKSVKDLQKQKILVSKDSTNGLIINAANVLIKKQGFSGLKLNKIAKLAGISKQMITEHFGNKNGLLRAVIQKANFTVTYDGGLDKLLDDNRYDNGKTLALKTIDDFLSHHLNNKVAQEISVQEFNKSTDLLNENAASRDIYFDKLFSLMIEFRNGNKADPKLVLDSIFKGINHFILESKIDKVPNYGLDMHNLNDQKVMREFLKMIIEAYYNEVERNKIRLN